MNPTSLGNMMICVGVCVLATVLPRILPLYAFSRELPAFVKTWLNYIPAAVMAALVAPDLLFYGGTFNPDPLNNVFLLAGIASMIFAIVSKNFFATIALRLTSSPRLRGGIPYCADLAVSRFDGFLLLDGPRRLTSVCEAVFSSSPQALRRCPRPSIFIATTQSALPSNPQFTHKSLDPCRNAEGTVGHHG